MRIFITAIADIDTLIKSKISSAAYNFSCNLIMGEIFDKVYSIPPLGIRKMDESMNPQGIEMIFCKVLRKYSVLRFFSVLVEQMQLFIKTPVYSSVWLYNLYSSNVFYFILLKLFKTSVSINIIILDFTKSEKKISLQYFLLWLINKADGVIQLANNDVFTCANSACLPGIVPNDNVVYPSQDKIEATFLISGVLNDAIAMPEKVLKAFSCLPQCELYITGVAQNENLFKEYDEHFSNIHYMGLVPFEEYKGILEKVSFCLSTRDKNYVENCFNFPSKIIEHLLYNRIVVSTIHYPQLDGINYVEIPSDADGMIQAIRDLMSVSPNELLVRYANQEQKVKSAFSVGLWNEVIRKIEANEK